MKNQVVRDAHPGDISYLDQMCELELPITTKEKGKPGFIEFEGNYFNGIIYNTFLAGDAQWLQKAKKYS